MDDLLISSAFVYDLDETLAHYSLRGEISKKIGYALAEAYDKKIFRTVALAAREAHPVTAAPGPEPGGLKRDWRCWANIRKFILARHNSGYQSSD